jgi:hypothetical protein
LKGGVLPEIALQRSPTSELGHSAIAKEVFASGFNASSASF